MKNDMRLYEQIPPDKDDFPLRLLYYVAHPEITPHWHEQMELNFFFSGRTKLRCGENEYEVGENDLAVINSAEMHSAVSRDFRGLRYLTMIIKPDFFTGIPDGKTAVYQNIISGDEYITRRFADVLSEYLKREPGWRLRILGSVYFIMARLNQRYIAAEYDAKVFRKKLDAAEKLNTVLDYINTRYASEKILPKTLADMIYMSESCFYKFFKASTGKTLISYVNQLRIKKACGLLSAENCAMTLSEISACSGFSDINYFCRVFKQYTGTTSGDFAKLRE